MRESERERERQREIDRERERGTEPWREDEKETNVERYLRAEPISTVLQTLGSPRSRANPNP